MAAITVQYQEIFSTTTMEAEWQYIVLRLYTKFDYNMFIIGIFGDYTKRFRGYIFKDVYG